MNPEEYLEFLAATETFTNGISHIRTRLIEQEWSSHGAEQASMMLFGLAAQGKA